MEIAGPRLGDTFRRLKPDSHFIRKRVTIKYPFKFAEYFYQLPVSRTYCKQTPRFCRQVSKVINVIVGAQCDHMYSYSLVLRLLCEVVNCRGVTIIFTMHE